VTRRTSARRSPVATVVVNAVSAKSGGAATYIRNLVRDLSRVACHLRFVVCVPPGIVVRDGLDPSRVRVVETAIGSASAWRRLLWDQIMLRRLLKLERAAVLLSTSDFGMWRCPNSQALLVRNSLFWSSEYLTTLMPQRSALGRWAFRVRRWLVGISIKHANVVVTPSESMMADVRRSVAVDDSKARVIPFGVPLERFRRRSDPPLRSEQAASDQFQVLLVSEYGEHKGLGTLLRAFLILQGRAERDIVLQTTASPDDFPGSEIVTRHEDRALARHPALAGVVRFLGPVPYEKIGELYSSSDLFVLPSLTESFGHPLVEAMASGLPIVASDIPVCREICEDAAVFFRPGDPGDLADKIVELRRDPASRAKLGENGRRRVEARFTWEEHVHRLIRVLEDLAA